MRPDSRWKRSRLIRVRCGGQRHWVFCYQFLRESADRLKHGWSSATVRHLKHGHFCLTNHHHKQSCFRISDGWCIVDLPITTHNRFARNHPKVEDDETMRELALIWGPSHPAWEFLHCVVEHLLCLRRTEASLFFLQPWNYFRHLYGWL